MGIVLPGRAHLSWSLTCFLADGLGFSVLSMSPWAARGVRLPL